MRALALNKRNLNIHVLWHVQSTCKVHVRKYVGREWPHWIRRLKLHRGAKFEKNPCRDSNRGPFGTWSTFVTHAPSGHRLAHCYTYILYGTEILRFAPKMTIFKRLWSRPLKSDLDEQTFIWKLISSAFHQYKYHCPRQPTGGDSLHRILHVYSCLYTTCTRIGSLWTKFLGGGLHNIQLTVPKPIVNW